MSDKTEPSQSVANDAKAEKAPDPRRHYSSPEDLAEDIDLEVDKRIELLREWQQELDRRLEAEAEGMSASDPISHDQESRLANEYRRVCKALESITAPRTG